MSRIDLADVRDNLKTEIAESYIGTCSTVSDWLMDSAQPDGDFIDSDDVQEILADAGVECCNVCGWFSEIGDMTEIDGELTCPECVEGGE